MKFCDRCSVKVTGDSKRCPLCQGKLIGESEQQEAFPIINSIYHKKGQFLKSVTFCLVMITVISAALNVCFFNDNLWSIGVLGAVSCVWIWLVVALRRRRNILKKIMDQVIVICLFSILFDFIFGWYKWSLNYVVPGVFICAMLTTTILTKVLKVSPEDYLVYTSILIIFGVIPATLIFTNLISNPILSIICLVVSVLSAAKIIIFDWSLLRAELNRRLHL